MRQVTNIVLAFACAALCSEFAVGQVSTSSVDSHRRVGSILGITPEESGKCGTAELMLAYLHWNQLSEQSRASIQKVLSRPAKQKDRLSRSGRFRVHYDTTGVDAPAFITGGSAPQRIPSTVEQYVDSVAAAFDAVWKLEVDTLGFLPPPTDGTQGGGPEYDVYVSELGSSLFGQTLWNDPGDMIQSGVRKTFSTYIEIDNDFLGMRTPGLDGLRVTAAHEFHHAIQIGNYGYWTTVPNNDFYFYELTSVWMEHLAYGGISDYYFDLPNYFQRFRDSQNRSLTFTTYGSGYLGYERSIWAQYLAKRFGRDIMRQIWTGMINDPMLTSTAKVLQQHGSAIESEFAGFSFWNYYTADRAIPGKYYDDASYWPRFLPNVSSTFGGLTSSVSSSGWPLSTQFCQFVASGDTITAILADVDAASAYLANPPSTAYVLQLSSSSGSAPFQKVAGGLSLSFNPSDASKWKTLYLESSTKSTAGAASDPFPNPLRLVRDQHLGLPLPGTSEKRGTVYFINAAMELVFSRDYDVSESFGGRYLYIPASDLRTGIPSGVYFVKASCGDKEFKWKVVIVQ